MTHCSVRGAAFEKGVKGAAIRLEIEKCENCGGKMKIIACIEDPDGWGRFWLRDPGAVSKAPFLTRSSHEISPVAANSPRKDIQS